MSEIRVYETLSPSDTSITKYVAHKQWNVSSSEFNKTGSYFMLSQGVYSNNNKLPIGTLISEQQNWDGSYKKSLYSSISHLYYGNIYYPLNTVPLNEYCTVFSVSKYVYGNYIQPGTVQITYKDLSNITHTLHDDYNYNLVDTSINTSSFAPTSNNILYLGFNNKFNASSLLINESTISLEVSESNISYAPGLKDLNNNSYGYAAVFNGNSSRMYVRNYDSINISQLQNFAISTHINISTGSTSGSYYIVSKRTLGSLSSQTNNINYTSISYPYELYYDSNTNYIYGQRSDGINTTIVSASFSPTNSYKHIVLQKSSSILELYVDGTKRCSVTDTVNNNVHNFSDLYIGSLGNQNVYSGSIDEFRLYNTYLTQNQILTLSSASTALQTNVVGNVLYEHGMIIYSTPSKLHFDSLSGSVSYNLQFKSTVNLNEHTYVCKVPAGEYNHSLNPSMYNENGTVNSNVTSSAFHPYITTIGLYNKKYELVAVAKLSNPVPKLNTVDLNFMVKFDVWQ